MPGPSGYPLLPLALLAALPLAAPAAAAEPSWLGAANCRIAPLQPAPRDGEVSWKGACVDGYASGRGVLAWRSDKRDNYSIAATLVRGDAAGEALLKTPEYTYTGTLKDGLPHGQGYFEYAAGGGWYEGEVAAGLPHGQGIRLKLDRSRHTGVWVAGKRNGWGEATFSNGGSYTGSWKNDKFDGQGKIVYAGSGRTWEGLFRDGRVAGLPEPEVAKGSYAIRAKAAGSRALMEDRVTGYVPLTAGWNDLTPAQQNRVRQAYPALEAGDEPPFPAKGERALFDAVARINEALGVVEGVLGVHVLIGKDGKPLTVTTYGAPHPGLVRAVSNLMVLQEYKPAVCHGEPCEMVYGLQFAFSVSQ